MLWCFVDESGSAELLNAVSDPGTPVFVIGGVIIDHARLPSLTRDWVRLKQARTGAPAVSMAAALATDTKGARVRRNLFVSSSKAERSNAFAFIDDFLSLLERHEVQILGTVWLKELREGLSEQETYAVSVQRLAQDFHARLASERRRGLMVLDARSAHKDRQVIEAVFNDKYLTATSRTDRLRDELPNLMDLPHLGHSNYSFGLQLADYVVSALIFPLAATAYRASWIANRHVDHGFGALRYGFGARVEALQYRYRAQTGRRGGFVVGPAGRGHDSRLLFRK
ncbi:MAG: DUF3800 domain-containing protein [Solirubrobacteraceae bacterium]